MALQKVCCRCSRWKHTLLILWSACTHSTFCVILTLVFLSSTLPLLALQTEFFSPFLCTVSPVTLAVPPSAFLVTWGNLTMGKKSLSSSCFGCTVDPSFSRESWWQTELRHECEAVLQQLHCAVNTYFNSNKQIKCCQFYSNWILFLFLKFKTKKRKT